jgi:hypothetical protein
MMMKKRRKHLKVKFPRRLSVYFKEQLMLQKKHVK